MRVLCTGLVARAECKSSSWRGAALSGWLLRTAMARWRRTKRGNIAQTSQHIKNSRSRASRSTHPLCYIRLLFGLQGTRVENLQRESHKPLCRVTFAIERQKSSNYFRNVDFIVHGACGLCITCSAVHHFSFCRIKRRCLSSPPVRTQNRQKNKELILEKQAWQIYEILLPFCFHAENTEELITCAEL